MRLGTRTGIALMVPLVVAGITGCGGSANASHRNGREATLQGQARQPHCVQFGREISVDAVAEANPGLKTGFLLPNTDDANATNLTSVWQCNDVTTMFRFSSGYDIAEGGHVPTDAQRAWESLAKDDLTASVEQIDGTPALVFDPQKDPSGFTPGGVNLVVNGTRIIVIGNGRLDLKHLVAVAAPLKPATAEDVKAAADNAS